MLATLNPDKRLKACAKIKIKKGIHMDKKIVTAIALIVLFVFTLLYWTRFQVIDVHAMNGVGFTRSTG